MPDVDSRVDSRVDYRVDYNIFTTETAQCTHSIVLIAMYSTIYS